MKKNSAYKLLFLLNLLLNSEKSKKEISEEFKKKNLPISNSLITHYINSYIQNEIDIKTKINSSKENIYYIENNIESISFSEDELSAISQAKKILLTQKNYDRIRKTMRLFYKIACFIKDKEQQREFINFGYYSTINWNLVNQLEKHCKEKNIIVLDYILPNGGNIYLTILANELKISNWSQRLYLHGALYNSKRFSHLPVDRIYMVKEIVQKNADFDMIINNLTFIVSKKTYEKAPFDEKEKITNEKDGKLTIQRPLDDEFYILQRLMSFCPELYFISDKKIKDLLKNKLETLKDIYDKRIDR